MIVTKSSTNHQEVGIPFFNTVVRRKAGRQLTLIGRVEAFVKEMREVSTINAGTVNAVNRCGWVSG